MGDLLGAILPLALGVAVSPLGLVALLAVLMSQRPAANAVAFIAGWLLSIVVVGGLAFAVSSAFTVKPKSAHPATWVAVVHILIGLVLIAGAWWTWQHGRRHIKQMARAKGPRDVVAAAPELPGWLKSVSTFRPFRCLLLGFALCTFNPVDASCTIGGGVNLRVSDVGVGSKIAAIVLFIVIGCLPLVVPLAIVAVKGAAAQAPLIKMRNWIGENNGLLNAGMFAAIGVLMLVKGIKQL